MKNIIISNSDREADWIKHVGGGRESELKIFEETKKRLIRRKKQNESGKTRLAND